jgi:hypothetical protein
MLLRTLGYETRLVSGFYAHPRRYDRRSRSTPIVKEDIHVWAEIRCQGDHWSAIEPTPGYELLGPHQSWVELTIVRLGTIAAWLRERYLRLLGIAGFLAASWWCRFHISDIVASYWCRFAFFRGSPRRAVISTMKLIERRARWSGMPRKSNVTIARWIEQTTESFALQDPRPAREVVAAMEWACYAPTGNLIPFDVTDGDIFESCKRVLAELSLARFRTSARSSAIDSRRSAGGDR